MKAIYLAALCLLCTVHLTNAQGTWVSKKNFGGSGRMGAVAFSIGNLGYLGTGSPWGGSNFTDFWEYDPVTDIWTQKANFAGPNRYRALGFGVGTKGYVTNGLGSGSLADMWEYDQAGNTWTAKSSMGAPGRFGCAGFVVGTNIYIGTGTAGSYTTDFWEYNTVTDAWTQKANFGGNAKIYGSGFSVGNFGYMGFGCEMSSIGMGRADMWRYDPATNTWLQKASLPGPGRSEAVAMNVGNLGYVTTGTSNWGSGALDDCWEYHPITDTWVQVANFPGGKREHAVGFNIGCNMYVSTGFVNDISGTLKIDLWQFTPDSACLIIGGPKALGNTAVTSICTGSCINFNNQSTSASIYTWSFPGATPNSSTATNPINICYNTPGTYDVQLIASDGTSSDTLLLPGYITVSAPSVAGTVAANPDSVCMGATTTLTVAGSSGNLQWQTGTNGITFTDITGATQSTYTSPPITQTTYFRATASGACSNDTTAVVQVNVKPKTVAGTLAAVPDSVCSGNTSVLTVTGNNGSIQWQSSFNGVTFGNVPGATQSTYTTPPITQTTYFRTMVQGVCGADSSITQIIYLKPGPDAGFLSATKDTLCENTGITSTLSANGANGNLQWQSSTDKINYANISSTTSTYTTPPLMPQTTTYRVIATNGQCTPDTSAPITVWIIPSPIADFTFSTGGMVITYNSGGSSSDVTVYSWEFGDGTTSGQPNPTHTYTYRDTFEVCLTVFNNSNCAYTLCKIIDLLSEDAPALTPGSGSLTLYPNPAHDAINMSITGLTGQYQLRIYNVLGQQMGFLRDYNLSGKETIPIELWNLAAGSYHLVLCNEKEYYSQRFVKQ